MIDLWEVVMMGSTLVFCGLVLHCRFLLMEYV
jgi:hypothetical protein